MSEEFDPENFFKDLSRQNTAKQIATELLTPDELETKMTYQQIENAYKRKHNIAYGDELDTATQEMLYGQKRGSRNVLNKFWNLARRIYNSGNDS